MNETNFPILIKSNNVFNDILLPQRERKISTEDRKTYILFYRYIGFQSEKEYFDKIISLHRELLKLDKLYLLFKSKIDLPYNTAIMDKLNSCSNLFTLDHFLSGELADIIHEHHLFDISNNEIINTNLKNAFKEIIKLYAYNEKLSNMNIGKNFIAKLLCWIFEYLPGVFDSFITIFNPKALYYGSIKKHEGYFLILLSLMGFDVLFINSSDDEIFNFIDKEKKYSFFIEEPNKMQVKEIDIMFTNSSASKNETNENITSRLVLINSSDIFTDIFIPVNKRNDYIEGSIPTYPVYFQRYIGLDNSDRITLDNYYNSIFNLDKKLKNIKNGYVKFENHVPMPSNEETSNILNDFSKNITFFDINKKDTFIQKIMNLKSFPKSKDANMNSLIRNAFKQTINIYLEKESNINLSKAQNFLVKLISWINRYIDELFKYSIKEDNPKILYYGEIKKHEVYFLIYCSKLGCDIVYINSDFHGDESFEAIDSNEIYTKLTKLNTSSLLEDFPLIEKYIKKATVAYNASQEIQQVIYGETETGLFKPRQFENGTTKAVGLKTTYDELKLLWNEPSKIRPEFKVDLNTVYIPNLFVKINGVFEDIKNYWTDYKYFSTSKNTYVIKKVPFTNVTYSKQDLSSSAFLFDDKGMLDSNKLYQSPLYKLGYLKKSLQDFLVYKINELILSNILKNAAINKYKILMTIINMQEEILKLLEQFDYTQDVPKIVFYLNSKDNFSNEDSILIAFLNLVGFDICIFTPTNYNNIEFYLDENLFDVLQLPNVAFDLQIPNLLKFNNDNKKSFINKIFNFRGGNK